MLLEGMAPGIEERIEPVTESGCWLWTGEVAWYGHGRIGIWEGGKRTRRVPAHVFVYALKRGPIPEGMWVLHRCDVACCVNPDHLYLGTAQDNTRDMVTRGRAKTFTAESIFPREHSGGKRMGRARKPRGS